MLIKDHPLHLSRRTFLKQAALGSAAVWTARSWAQVSGANSDVRVAVVGLRIRGRPHVSAYKALKGVRVAGLCDVDSTILEKAKGMVGAGAKLCTDFRELLDSKEIDAVSIATPNHLHALQAIWSLQAGKDVYVEKPVAHNLWEGRQLVAATAKYGRVVQVGTQCRSSLGLAEAVAWTRAGNLGRIKAVHGLCYKRRGSIGKITSPAVPPATVNYDLWAGPAPLAPIRRMNFHYDWHWQWATGNGDLGNQGVHQMDVARWFLGDPGIARQTLSAGGRIGYQDDGETPNTLLVLHDYPEAPLLFEVRGLTRSPTAGKAMDDYHGASIGVVVHCEGGRVVVPNYTDATAFDAQGATLKTWRGEASRGEVSHFGNFIDVVRSRKLSDLRAPVLDGHVSSGLCHTANISLLTGATVSPDALRERVGGSAALQEAAGRMIEHLRVHQIDYGATPLRLGAPLQFDPATERFTGPFAAAANQHLTREYRKPYVVPQIA